MDTRQKYVISNGNEVVSANKVGELYLSGGSIAKFSQMQMRPRKLVKRYGGRQEIYLRLMMKGSIGMLEELKITSK